MFWAGSSFDKDFRGIKMADFQKTKFKWWTNEDADLKKKVAEELTTLLSANEKKIDVEKNWHPSTKNSSETWS